MYWNKGTGIVKTLTDGTNSVQIVSGLINPVGITMDYKSSKLFWVEHALGQVQSSRLDGTDVVTQAQLAVYKLSGIAVDATRVYFSS